MKIKFRMSSRVMKQLHDYHLADGKREEAMSYVFANITESEFGVLITVADSSPVFLFADDCYDRRSGMALTLSNDVQNAVMVKFAASHYNCLINVHDHWFHNFTRFSAVDDADDLAFDRYLRETFEPMLKNVQSVGEGRPIWNLSLVLAQEGMDCRIVDSRGTQPFQVVDVISIIDEKHRLLHRDPTTYPLAKSRFSRHSDFISPAQQHQLQELQVALIGTGGIGSILCETLLRAGVGTLLLVDDDLVSESNLNRWQGGQPSDVGRAKVDVLTARLTTMFPDACILPFHCAVYEPELEKTLALSDVIVGGLDNDSARYFLNRLSLQYLLPYFDSAVEVDCANGLTNFRTRFFAVIPQVTACTDCTQFRPYDRANVIEDFMSSTIQAERRAAGYVKERPDIEAPSVYALNQRAAALLGMELLNYVCHWRPLATSIMEDWLNGVHQRADRSNIAEMPAPGCTICTYYAGAGDSEVLPRPDGYRLQSALKDFPAGQSLVDVRAAQVARKLASPRTDERDAI